MIKKKEMIEVEMWWKPGNGMMYNREALPHDHPEQMYNYVKREFGVKPEDYGIKHPLRERFKKESRSQLIDRIVELEKLIHPYL